jgi:hypothetical protein
MLILTTNHFIYFMSIHNLHKTKLQFKLQMHNNGENYQASAKDNIVTQSSTETKATSKTGEFKFGIEFILGLYLPTIVTQYYDKLISSGENPDKAVTISNSFKTNLTNKLKQYESDVITPSQLDKIVQKLTTKE